MIERTVQKCSLQAQNWPISPILCLTQILPLNLKQSLWKVILKQMHFLITISLNVMLKKRRKMILGPKMTIFPILGIM